MLLSHRDSSLTLLVHALIVCLMSGAWELSAAVGCESGYEWLMMGENANESQQAELTTLTFVHYQQRTCSTLRYCGTALLTFSQLALAAPEQLSNCCAITLIHPL